MGNLRTSHKDVLTKQKEKDKSLNTNQLLHKILYAIKDLTYAVENIQTQTVVVDKADFPTPKVRDDVLPLNAAFIPSIDTTNLKLNSPGSTVDQARKSRTLESTINKLRDIQDNGDEDG